MPEIIRLADRLLVMSQDRVVGELENTPDYRMMSARIMSFIHVGDSAGTSGSEAQSAVSSPDE